MATSAIVLDPGTELPSAVATQGHAEDQAEEKNGPETSLVGRSGQPEPDDANEEHGEGRERPGHAAVEAKRFARHVVRLLQGRAPR